MRTVFQVFDRFDEARQAQLEFARAGMAADHVGMLARKANNDGLTHFEVPGVGALAGNGAMRRMLDSRGVRDRNLGETLLRLGIPRDEIPRCVDAVAQGKILEAVVVDDDQERVARAVLDRYSQPSVEIEDLIVPVIREELEVGTRQVEAGGVRISSRVREVPVEQTITIREEKVTVERRIIDRPIDEQDDAFRDHTFDLRTRVEEPVVRKRAHVVEEIRVHKDRNERRENITDTLRHTDVQVSQIPNERGADAAYYRAHFDKYFGDRTDFATVAPAYEFGERLRRTTGGGDFGTIETDARSMWERRNPGSWEKFKEAVRAGWNRVKN